MVSRPFKMRFALMKRPVLCHAASTTRHGGRRALDHATGDSVDGQRAIASVEEEMGVRRSWNSAYSLSGGACSGEPVRSPSTVWGTEICLSIRYIAG